MFHLTFNMIKSLRMKVFDNMLRQTSQFYDREDNSSGNLVSVLSDDIKAINGASLELYALYFQAIIGMIAAVVISLAY